MEKDKDGRKEDRHHGSRKEEKDKDGRKEGAKDGRRATTEEEKAKEDLVWAEKAKEEYMTSTYGGVKEEERMIGIHGQDGMMVR